MKALTSSESDEWYTPSYIIEKARSTMGGIDLDPFSCKAAQETVKANRYYSLMSGQDGLSFPWFGRVWTNPPYGSLATKACSVALRHWQYGKIDQLIMLVRGDSDGLDSLLKHCNLWVRCDRIKFTPSEKVKQKKIKDFADRGKVWSNQPVPGSVIIYFGKNSIEFLDNFRDCGLIFPSSIN